MELLKKKVNFSSDLVKFLLDHGYAKPILFYKKRWSSKKFTLDEAITNLRPFFDDILINSKSQLTISQQRLQKEYKRHSTVVSIGDSGDQGWEKSDIYEVKGENGGESYYCVNQDTQQLPKIRQKSRDFLCVSFDEFLQIKKEKSRAFSK